MVVTWRHRANGRRKIDSRKDMDPINTGKRHRPNKSLFNGHVQVLLETIALSTGRLNNEAFIEILYARKEETVFFLSLLILLLLQI